MKRFLGFLLLLAILAGGGYYWWQQNAARIMGEQVQQMAQKLVVNPDQLLIRPKALSIHMKDLHTAVISELIISGKDLKLRNGLTLSAARLAMHDVEFSGPPFRITGIGSDSSFILKVTDSAVTQYLHTRGGQIARMKNVIPLDTITVRFHPVAHMNTSLSGQADVPLLGQVPISADGELVATTTPGQIDMNFKRVTVSRLSFGVQDVTNHLAVVNPIIDISEWPIKPDFTSIKCAQPGLMELRGNIVGANSSLL